MENIKDNELRSEDIEDTKQKEFTSCLLKLKKIGYSDTEAKKICKQLTISSDSEEEDFLLLVNEDDVLKDAEPSDKCSSSKISIFAKEHPEWDHDKVVAAAHGWCESHDNRVYDTINPIKLIGSIGGTLMSGRVERASDVSMRRLLSVVKLIKGKKGLKVGHAGIDPFLTSLPMKNLNRLQTKLESLVTEEQKFLTAEQQSQRSKYAMRMKKQDVMDSIWVSDQIEISNINTEMNNIIKAPVILAKELIQPYDIPNESGISTREYHFKPYEELKMAIDGLEELPMIIEHQPYVTEDNIIGYVRQFVADDDLRAIRGTAYFNQSKLPQILLETLKDSGKFGVSIGFLAILDGEGFWNGEKYNHAQRDIKLEHLAICLRSIPRCPIDFCGVNVDSEIPTEDQKFTIISKKSNYYNINTILNEIEETSNEKISDKDKESDNMNDSKDESGKIAGFEPKDLEAILTPLRKYMAGIHEEWNADQITLRIKKALQDSFDSLQKNVDDKNMDEKEFKDAIAEKDAKIKELEDIVRESLIKEIKSFGDAENIKKLNLEDKSVHDLKLIKDTVSGYSLPKKEA